MCNFFKGRSLWSPGVTSHSTPSPPTICHEDTTSRKKKLEENPAPCLCNGIPKAITCKSEFSKEARCTSGTVKRSISPKSLECWNSKRGEGIPPCRAACNWKTLPKFRFRFCPSHSFNSIKVPYPRTSDRYVKSSIYITPAFPNTHWLNRSVPIFLHPSLTTKKKKTKTPFPTHPSPPFPPPGEPLRKEPKASARSRAPGTALALLGRRLGDPTFREMPHRTAGVHIQAAHATTIHLVIDGWVF